MEFIASKVMARVVSKFSENGKEKSSSPLPKSQGRSSNRKSGRDICHRDRLSSQGRKRNHITVREWMSFRLQRIRNEAQPLLSSRRLFHQFLFNAYTMVESERLSFIKRNQKKLRVDKYKNLNETQGSDQSQGSNRGKRVILPSTFVGGRRYMDQLYFDGMVICSS
ncbi:hypothetical protein Lal_00042732 [Lupinus albus]|nr:hypothetical protein Lal_00042732 [Lupinus albus]